VFIPKYRRKALYGSLRQQLGIVFRELARHKECEIGEGHLMVDHVHMLLSIPAKSAVSYVVGFIKGKSAIHLARVHGGQKQNLVGQHFWARGSFVSTAGRDETVIREYMKKYGWKQKHFARVTSKNKNNGSLNPNAQYQRPMSTEEILESRVISWPITLYMCSTMACRGPKR
jgi:putative transposase